jgi:hypothetical protein
MGCVDVGRGRCRSKVGELSIGGKVGVYKGLSSWQED